MRSEGKLTGTEVQGFKITFVKMKTQKFCILKRRIGQGIEIIKYGNRKQTDCHFKRVSRNVTDQ